jgi:hypothetical protein
MSALVLLSLLGVGMFATTLGGGDDPAQSDSPEAEPETTEEAADPVVEAPADPAPSPEPVEPEQPETPADSIQGEELTLNGEATLVGTQGNDTLIVSVNEAGLGELETVNLGDGNDYADVPAAGPIVINGEAGNDTLSGSYTDILIGGDGDDVLNTAPGGSANGGAGNDTLNVNVADIYDGYGTLDAGEGDDVLNARSEIGYIKTDFPGAALVGGEGADDFNLSLHLDYNADFGSPASPDTETRTPAGITLSDFDRTEDTLLIEITRAEDSEGREFLSAELVETSFTHRGELISYTDIALSFGASETIGAHTATIRLGENVNITNADIVVVEV